MTSGFFTRTMWIRLIAIILLVSLPARADGVLDRIIETMVPNSITIIGESHKRPEAIQFFRSLISHYLQQDECLAIGLEIASDQQPIIDNVGQGKASVSDIDVAPMIDHQDFRSMIANLIGLQKQNECLKVVAVDASLVLRIDRDVWMAEKLGELKGQIPVIALLGSLHALKKVDWNFEYTKAYVAGILASKGHKVNSYPQIWTDRECKNKTRFIDADQQEATELLNGRLISLLNAHKTQAASNVVDGIVLWVCD